MKKEKEQEIKRLNNEIASIKNELAKYDEQLEECKKYKDFLDKLTPPEWFEEVKRKTVKNFHVTRFSGILEGWIRVECGRS